MHLYTLTKLFLTKESKVYHNSNKESSVEKISRMFCLSVDKYLSGSIELSMWFTGEYHT